jgi:GTP-binding protein
LGHEFLRHIERTRVLVHLLDGLSADPMADFAAINHELAAFGHGLSDKPQIVVLNKMDVPEVRESWPVISRSLKRGGHTAMAISAVAREGTRELLYRVAQMLAELPEETPALEVPVFRLEGDEDTFTVTWEEDGWRVSGARVERLAAMTVWNLDEAVSRFQRTLDRMGVVEALEVAGVQPGDTVRIGDRELEWEE